MGVLLLLKSIKQGKLIAIRYVVTHKEYEKGSHFMEILIKYSGSNHKSVMSSDYKQILVYLLNFSRVSFRLSKANNHLEIVTRDDLRLSLTNMDPDLEILAKLHQEQRSR
ncbi:Hypothetical predicted protein [Octopus vulgaris]|uniref:Uncharacterized protein n=1 Tax=Octopus vulgaris TaxID=6645 RepID=A0AA36AW65_OCTVU|nr:Hypothetical predicted protein [Octopus vulgaris]